jgi:hypothetical protein
MADIKNQIGTLSVNIAESILREIEQRWCSKRFGRKYFNKSNLN